MRFSRPATSYIVIGQRCAVSKRFAPPSMSTAAEVYAVVITVYTADSRSVVRTHASTVNSSSSLRLALAEVDTFTVPDDLRSSAPLPATLSVITASSDRSSPSCATTPKCAIAAPYMFGGGTYCTRLPAMAVPAAAMGLREPRSYSSPCVGSVDTMKPTAWSGSVAPVTATRSIVCVLLDAIVTTGYGTAMRGG